MSYPYLPANSARAPMPPPGVRGLRATIACSNCRKHKMKCKPTDDNLIAPCERCARRGLTCEYVSVNDQRDELVSGADATPAETTSDSRRGHRAPAPLPYTGPPPANQLPRYAGQPLPPLGQPSTHFAHPNPTSPGATQGPNYSAYYDSSLAGWAGSMPAPSAGPVSPMQSRHRANPPAAHAPAGTHRYNLPSQYEPFDPTRPAQSPGAHNTANHPVDDSTAQIFDPDSMPGDLSVSIVGLLNFPSKFNYRSEILHFKHDRPGARLRIETLHTPHLIGRAQRTLAVGEDTEHGKEGNARGYEANQGAQFRKSISMGCAHAGGNTGMRSEHLPRGLGEVLRRPGPGRVDPSTGYPYPSVDGSTGHPLMFSPSGINYVGTHPSRYYFNFCAVNLVFRTFPKMIGAEPGGLAGALGVSSGGLHCVKNIAPLLNYRRSSSASDKLNTPSLFEAVVFNRDWVLDNADCEIWDGHDLCPRDSRAYHVERQKQTRFSWI
ncbi:hypothetical protein FB451DRAFT_1187432 [Mycena latifolia]|nr:hypothetical protein FB451DRAFT_1187432 [Mycena latifolia]